MVDKNKHTQFGSSLKFSWRDLKAEATGSGIIALLILVIGIVVVVIWDAPFTM